MQVEKNSSCHLRFIPTIKCLLLYHPHHVCGCLPLRHPTDSKLLPAAARLYHLASAERALPETHGLLPLAGTSLFCHWMFGDCESVWYPPLTSGEGTARGWTFACLL